MFSCLSACVLTNKLHVKCPVWPDWTPGSYTGCDLFLPFPGRVGLGGEHTSSLHWNMVILSEMGTIL